MAELLHTWTGPEITECAFCHGKDFSQRFLGALTVGICEACLNKLVKDKLTAQGRWPY